MRLRDDRENGHYCSIFILSVSNAGVVGGGIMYLRRVCVSAIRQSLHNTSSGPMKLLCRNRLIVLHTAREAAAIVMAWLYWRR
jgi:hypothetical protein